MVSYFKHSYCRVRDDNIRSHENNGPGLIILKKKVEKLIERVDDLDFIIANSSDLVKQASYSFSHYC